MQPLEWWSTFVIYWLAIVKDSRDKLKMLFGQEKRVCEFNNADKVHAEKAI